MKFINLRKKTISLAFLLVFIFQFLAVSLISPTKAYAETSVDELRTRVQKIVKLEAFRRCVQESLTNDGIDRDDNPWNNLAGDKAVGHGIDTEDGRWSCDAQTNEWFKQLLVNGSDKEYYSGWKSGTNPYAAERNNNIKKASNNEDLYFINRDNDPDFDSTKNTEVLEGGPANGKVIDQINRTISVLEKGLTSDQKKAMRYIQLSDTLFNPNACNAYPVDANSPGDQVKIGGQTYYIANDGRGISAGEVAIGHGPYAWGDKGAGTCAVLAQNTQEVYDAYVNVTGEETVTPPGSANPTGSNTADNSCEALGGVLSWLMCPALVLVGGALNWVDTQIIRLLEVDRDKFATGTSGDAMYNAWSQFRNIGLSLLVAAMLVMVISTAIGSSFLDAYTVKKAFPRMVMSILFMLLSWYFCIFLIDISNIIGQGILGLMTSPFGIEADSLTRLFNPSVGGAIIQFGGLAITAAVLVSIPPAIGILLSWFASGLLIMGIAFLVLIARQMFIVVLILFSPIAILSWIFPNNNKLWKLWWESFTKLLLMFPLIMALIGAGRIFAGVIAETSGAGAESLLNPLLKLTAYIIPYAFIPFTFKTAGGIFGNLAGMVNDRSKGAFDRLRKGRQKGFSEAAHKAQQGDLFRGSRAGGNGQKGNLAYRLNRGIQTATLASKAGIKPTLMKGNINSARAIQEGLHADELLEKNADVKAISGDDDLVKAMAKDNSREAIESRLKATGRFGEVGSEKMNEAVAMVQRAQRSAAPAALKQVAAVALAASGTGFSTHSEMYQAAIDASEGNVALRNSILAKQRSASERARRFDLSAPGHVESASAMDDLENGVDARDVNERMRAVAFRQAGAQQLVQGKPSVVRDLTTQLATDYNDAVASNDLDRATELASQITAVRGAMGSATPEGRQQISAMLAAVGIDETAINPQTGSAISTDEQLGIKLAVVAGNNAVELGAAPPTPENLSTLAQQATQAVRTRAGLYDVGGGNRTPEQIRASQMMPPREQ